MFYKIFTLFRARAHDAEQALIDSHALTILEQEIRDAADGVRDATRELTGLMAREIQDRRALDAAEKRVVDHEAYARKALERADEGLALQIAEAVADAEADRDRLRAAVDAGGREINRLRLDIGKADARIGELRRELAAARSRGALQRAEGLVARRTQGAQSALAAAEETLARVKELQTDQADRLAAARRLREESDGTALLDKLRLAGIAEPARSTAESVLARLRAGMGGAGAPPTPA